MEQTVTKGDCLVELAKLAEGSANLVFADPPFNIGYDYDLYDDRKAPDHYVQFTEAWAAEAYRTLASNGSLWMCGSDHFISEMDLAVRRQGFIKRSWVIWHYTFGQNLKGNMTKAHTHIIYYVKSKRDFVFNADDPKVRHKSARQVVYKDKRANPAGRLPDDVWCILEEQISSLNHALDDVWFFSRLAGSFKERRGGHSCQMPEAILERIIRLTTNPGDLILDPFAGTGTTAAVAKKTGRSCVGWDISPAYVSESNKRLAEIKPYKPPK